jgi:hypothetical protein
MPNEPISPPPPELLELLQDPRLDGMEEQYRARGKGGRTLAAPVKRPAELSRFVELAHCDGEGPNLRAKWVNEPKMAFLRTGDGMGLSALTEVPRIEQHRKRPRKLPQFWFLSGFFVASPQIVELFARRSADGIETRPSFTIAGLEPLQSRYASFDGVTEEIRDVRHVADALVITRLLRLLKEAAAHCNALHVPLLASAHDYAEYVVEIPYERRQPNWFDRVKLRFAKLVS